MNEQYSYTFNILGATSVEIENAEQLPSGLSYDASNGTISGMITSHCAGRSLSIKVRNDYGYVSLNRYFQVKNKLQDAFTSQQYEFALSSTTGEQATWTVKEGSALPNGLEFTTSNAGNMISGIPGVSGLYEFTLCAESNGSKEEYSYILKVTTVGNEEKKDDTSPITQQKPPTYVGKQSVGVTNSNGEQVNAYVEWDQGEQYYAVLDGVIGNLKEQGIDAELVTIINIDKQDDASSGESGQGNSQKDETLTVQMPGDNESQTQSQKGSDLYVVSVNGQGTPDIQQNQNSDSGKVTFNRDVGAVTTFAIVKVSAHESGPYSSENGLAEAIWNPSIIQSDANGNSVYIVQRGDTLSEIAQKQNTTVEAIWP